MFSSCDVLRATLSPTQRGVRNGTPESAIRRRVGPPARRIHIRGTFHSGPAQRPGELSVGAGLGKIRRCNGSRSASKRGSPADRDRPQRPGREFHSARGLPGIRDRTGRGGARPGRRIQRDRKSTRLNSSHVAISYAVFCLKKKNNNNNSTQSYKRKIYTRD